MFTTYTSAAAAILLATLARLLIMAGIPWFVGYVWKPAWLTRRKLNPVYPSAKTTWAEIRLDLLNLSHFVLYGTLIYYFYNQSRTLIYLEPGRYGLLYLPFSFFALMVLQDTWFYWSHRLFHLRRFQFLGHETHHRFHNPTPWSAFAVHPLEANLQILFHFVIVFALPLHPSVMAAYFLLSFHSAVVGHSGFRLGNPRSRIESNSTYHYLHHRHGDCYYGLYFVFWDRVMGTTRERESHR